MFWPFRWLRIFVNIGAPVVCFIYLTATVMAAIQNKGSKTQSVNVHGANSTGDLMTEGVLLASIGVATDIFLLLLPLRVVFQLKMQ